MAATSRCKAAPAPLPSLPPLAIGMRVAGAIRSIGSLETRDTEHLVLHQYRRPIPIHFCPRLRRRWIRQFLRSLQPPCGSSAE